MVDWNTTAIADRDYAIEYITTPSKLKTLQMVDLYNLQRQKEYTPTFDLSMIITIEYITTPSNL